MSNLHAHGERNDAGPSLNQSMEIIQSDLFSTHDGYAVALRAHGSVRTALHHHDKSFNGAECVIR